LIQIIQRVFTILCMREIRKDSSNMQCNITIVANTEEDIIIALEEVMRKVSEGYTSGMDSGETGSYDFNIED